MHNTRRNSNRAVPQQIGETELQNALAATAQAKANAAKVKADAAKVKADAAKRKRVADKALKDSQRAEAAAATEISKAAETEVAMIA